MEGFNTRFTLVILHLINFIVFYSLFTSNAICSAIEFKIEDENPDDFENEVRWHKAVFYLDLSDCLENLLATYMFLFLLYLIK